VLVLAGMCRRCFVVTSLFFLFLCSTSGWPQRQRATAVAWQDGMVVCRAFASLFFTVSEHLVSMLEPNQQHVHSFCCHFSAVLTGQGVLCGFCCACFCPLLLWFSSSPTVGFQVVEPQIMTC
jgi:hypothetical protein